MNQAITESDKIKSLRELLSIVVENTKRANQAKAAKADKEERALFKHVTILLGREPHGSELMPLRQ